MKWANASVFVVMLYFLIAMLVAKEGDKVILGIGIVVAIFSACAVSYDIFNIERVKNRTLWNVKVELNIRSRSKLHNIRSNYNRINNLIEAGQIDLAKDYLDRSAYYFTFLMNENRNKWSLGNEKKMFEAYYNAERLLYGNVEIKQNYNGLDVDGISFISDVFTTLLNNSMRHAFKNKTDNCKFHILVKKQGELLSFQISDNGVSSTIDHYLVPDRGLFLLKLKIRNAFRLRGFKNTKDHFAIEINEYNGTTVKFLYPYESA